jgi:hypothetical protein
MLHRSKKLLRRGDQQYFNEKRPVNVFAGSGTFRDASNPRAVLTE